MPSVDGESSEFVYGKPGTNSRNVIGPVVARYLVHSRPAAEGS